MTRGDRAGGWAAIATALLSLAVVALVIAGMLHGGMSSDGPLPGPVDRSLAASLGLAVALLAGAQALVAVTVHRRLGRASWVSRLGLAAALAGALFQLAGGALSAAQEARGVHDPLATLLVELAPAGIGIWAICAAAAAWRAGFGSRPLRIVGAIFGGAAMIQPGFPPAAAIALLAGLAWWIGLAAVLLRAPRSTPG